MKSQYHFTKIILIQKNIHYICFFSMCLKNIHTDQEMYPLFFFFFLLSGPQNRQNNKLTKTTTTKNFWKRIFAPVTMLVIEGYCCWGWLNWPAKRRAPKHEKTNMSQPGHTQTVGLRKMWYKGTINASPVGLCWIRKRKGLSRVISSTAMRENITAANKRGEMKDIGMKKSWWKFSLCIFCVIQHTACCCSFGTMLIDLYLDFLHDLWHAQLLVSWERDRERNVTKVIYMIYWREERIISHERFNLLVILVKSAVARLKTSPRPMSSRTLLKLTSELKVNLPKHVQFLSALEPRKKMFFFFKGFQWYIYILVPLTLAWTVAFWPFAVPTSTGESSGCSGRQSLHPAALRARWATPGAWTSCRLRTAPRWHHSRCLRWSQTPLWNPVVCCIRHYRAALEHPRNTELTVVEMFCEGHHVHGHYASIGAGEHSFRCIFGVKGHFPKTVEGESIEEDQAGLIS